MNNIHCIVCNTNECPLFYHNRNFYCEPHYEEQRQKQTDVEDYFFRDGLHAVFEFDKLEEMKGK